MLQTIFEDRVSLDFNQVQEYNLDGSKKTLLQAIFKDESYSMETTTVVRDDYSDALNWESLDWFEDNIIEVADFGGDFFQLISQGFNPIADTIKLADFTDTTPSNTFLNLVAQTIDDVDFSYNATTAILTLTLDSGKVNGHPST